MGRLGKILVWLGGAAAVTVIGTVVWMVWMVNGVISGAREVVSEAGLPERETVYFLQAEGFDPGAPGAALVLHPLATGGETLAITDTAALSAAAETAFYTDDPAAERRLVLLSVLFLSPPGVSPRQPYASLFMDGAEVATLTCFRLHCEAADHVRDLAGLVEAGRPASFDFLQATGVDAIRAEATSVAADRDRLLVSGEGQLPPQAARFDGYVDLNLPTQFHPWEEYSGYDDAPLRQQIADDLGALIADLGITAEIESVTMRLSWSNYMLMRDGAPVFDTRGAMIGDGVLPRTSPVARIWITSEDVQPLQAQVRRFDALAQLEPPDIAAVEARIPPLLAEHGLDGAPEEYDLIANVFEAPRTRATLSGFTEPEVTLTFYRLAP
jgi:hypothetical protein